MDLNSGMIDARINSRPGFYKRDNQTAAQQEQDAALQEMVIQMNRLLDAKRDSRVNELVGAGGQMHRKQITGGAPALPNAAKNLLYQFIFSQIPTGRAVEHNLGIAKVPMDIPPNQAPDELLPTYCAAIRRCGFNDYLSSLTHLGMPMPDDIDAVIQESFKHFERYSDLMHHLIESLKIFYVEYLIVYNARQRGVDMET